MKIIFFLERQTVGDYDQGIIDKNFSRT